MIEQGDRNVDLYEHVTGQGSNNSRDDDPSFFNFIYVDMKQSIPTLYSNNPKIFFEPEEPGAETDAQIAELAVNSKWEERMMKDVMRDGIKTTKLYGVCGFKTYFYFDGKGDPNIEDDYYGRVANDDVRTDRIPLKNMLKDSAYDWNSSPYIIHEIHASKEEIAERFELSEDEITVTHSSTNKEKSYYDGLEHVRSALQFGTYYEIEDRKKGEISIIVKGINRFVQKPTKKKYPYATMYDFLQYNEIPDRNQVFSDYVFWRDQMHDANVFRTMIVNHAKKSIPKYKVRGELEDYQRAQVKSSLIGSHVELKADQDIDLMPNAQMDPAVFQGENLARSDIQLITKQSPPGNPFTEKTATEVKVTEAASVQVSTEFVGKLEGVMVSIADKWVQLMKENYTASRVVKLTGISDAQFAHYKDDLGLSIEGDTKNSFIKYTKDDMDKKLKANIAAGSTLPDNDQTRIGKFQGFMQFMMANPVFAQSLDIEGVIDEASELFGVRSDNLTRRKDNPMEESRLLNSGVYVSPMLSEDHTAHLLIHERESNGNDQNMIHILGHKMLQAQLENNNFAKQASMIQNAPQGAAGMTGQSQMGMGGQLQPDIPQPAQPAEGGAQPPVPNTGGGGIVQ